MDYRSIIGELVLMKITLKKTSSRRTYSTQNDTQTVISFNHAIGKPQKIGIPLFDYEHMLFDTLQKYKYF